MSDPTIFAEASFQMYSAKKFRKLVVEELYAALRRKFEHID